LELTNGTRVERDVGSLLRGPVFQHVRSDPEAFRQVRAEGGTVVWPGGLDLCPDTVIWGGMPPVDTATDAATDLRA
jgi:hypothetical protein